MTEQDLKDYNQWLMEVWNPNQLYIPFVADAPSAYLSYLEKNKKAPLGVGSTVVRLIDRNKKNPEKGKVIDSSHIGFNHWMVGWESGKIEREYGADIFVV